LPRLIIAAARNSGRQAEVLATAGACYLLTNVDASYQRVETVDFRRDGVEPRKDVVTICKVCHG
jgi:hypothetical protein